MSDNATRSEHVLNSINKSCNCKLQNNWIKCDRLGNRHKNTYFPICQTFPTPDEYALYKDNFADQEGNLVPQAPLGVSQLSRKFKYHSSHKAFVISWQGGGGKWWIVSYEGTWCWNVIDSKHLSYWIRQSRFYCFLFAIAKLNEKRKGTKGMKRCRKLWLSQET